MFLSVPLETATNNCRKIKSVGRKWQASMLRHQIHSHGIPRSLWLNTCQPGAPLTALKPETFMLAFKSDNFGPLVPHFDPHLEFDLKFLHPGKKFLKNKTLNGSVQCVIQISWRQWSYSFHLNSKRWSEMCTCCVCTDGSVWHVHMTWKYVRVKCVCVCACAHAGACCASTLPDFVTMTVLTPLTEINKSSPATPTA